MAPGPTYEALQDNGYDDVDIDEIDFSDLNEQFEVRLEEGLDAFVVLDGLPVVPEASKDKLVKFVLKKLRAAGDVKEDAFYMPISEEGKSEGYAFVEFATTDQANQAVKSLNAIPLDKKHTMFVNKLTDIERYGREGRINEEYEPPQIEPYKEREHLRWWLGDDDGRDQFVMYRSDNVGVFWNEREEPPENIVDRLHWTETFVQWSPMGTFLASMHARGVLLWGGKSWSRLKRLTHPGVNLIDFSPNENYVTTWSHRPVQVEEDNPILSPEEDGKNYIIWDVSTGKPLRSFVNLEQGQAVDEEGKPVKKKMTWPAFKWSADDKYVARLNQGQSVSIYELPRMNLLNKESIKIEGVVDFEWSPTTPQRDGFKTYEQLFCFWTPEIGSNPAKVGLMSIPSKEIVRTRNLFNVSDAKLHWQSQSQFLCVKVDRHSKSKKSLATNLEIFRVRERGVPVEVVDSIKDPVINFAWEPKGDRFVLITAGEIPMNTAVPPKTAVSFFCPEKGKGMTGANFKHIRTLDKRNSNGIYWSPRGRFVVVATVQSAQSNELDFYDLDYEGEKEEKDKDLAANLQYMSTADHYGVTDVDWDPSGRYVATSASVWKNALESGFHLYDFKGQMLREEHVDRFKQFSWRPRPPTMLSKDEQKQVRRNLREYSKVFDDQDQQRKTSANRALIDQRKRLLAEWYEFEQEAKAELREQMLDARVRDGLPEEPDEEEEEEAEDESQGEVVEEIVEDIVKETEEVM